jgi:hypothetical protein
MFKKLILFFVLLTTMVGRMCGATTTWNFTTISLSANTDSWTATGSDLNTWRRSFSEFSTTTVNGLGNLLFNGTWSIENNKDLWMHTGAAIQIPVTNGQIVTVVGTSNTAGGISVTNGSINTITPSSYAFNKSFTATANGYVTLTNNNTDNRYFYFTSITVEDAPEIYFEPGTYTANIQDYNLFTEPTLHYPEGATVVYSSNDQKKANILGNKDVVFRGTGIVTINATVTYKGVEFLAQYNVTVNAPQAEPVINGNTCTLSGVGRLNPQSANVPGLAMEFGNIYMGDPNKNTTIVQSINNNLYASTIDQNGYRHIWWENGIPYQGSFYIFKPTVNGTLKVWVSNNTSSKTAYLIDRDNPSTKISVTDLGIATSNSPDQVTATLTAGKTYYLCTSGETLLLNKFSYEPSFKFSANSACKPNGYAPSVQDPFDEINLVGVSGNVSYSTEIYGNITGATVDANGHITNITYTSGADQGGAVVVHATCDAGTATYVLTVAYKQNLWDFTLTYDITDNGIAQGLEHGAPKSPVNILDNLKSNNTDWAMTYKVRTYENSVLTYLNAPVISNATRVEGNNADYNHLTAGLLIKAESKSFGSNAVLPSEYYSGSSIDTEKLYDALNYDANALSTNNQSRATILTLYYGSELTIPDLKAGDYVRMKWKSYDNNKGDKIELTNLTDLEGKDMEYIFASSIRDGGSNNGEGYHVFKVKMNADVKFRVGDSGWLNIYSIQVVDPSEAAKDRYTTFKDDHTYNDKINLYSKAMDTNLSRPKNSAITFDSGTSVKWENTGGAVRGQQNVAIEYSLEGLDGGAISSTLAGTEISEQGQLTLKGHGQCVVVSKGFTVLDHLGNNEGYKAYDRTKYVRYYVDLERTLITVNETNTVAQEYPYTWNFADLSQTSIDNLTNDPTNWSVNNGVFTPKDAYQTTFVTGSALGYVKNDDDKKIKEYKGFGINTHVANGYSTDLKKISVTSAGLVVGESTAQSTSPTFTIPAVPSEQTVYVRYSGNGSVTLTNGGNTSVSTVSYTDSNTDDKVCNIVGTGSTQDGTAGNVIITASDVTIKAIGVTNLKKEGSFYSSEDGLYYNSECQAYDINYNYTDHFTGTQMGAFLVLSTDASTNTVTTEDITIVPATIGSIIYTTDKSVDHPIFVPSVNQAVTDAQKEEAIHSSILTGIVSAQTLPASNSTTNYYVFTNVWGYVKGNDYSDTNSQTASIPGFFRVNSSGTLKAHRAYLAEAVSTTTSPVKAYTLFPWNGDFVDAIEAVPTTETEKSIDANGSFYTLQGAKIEGRPKHGGIYIQNGKKIFVK